MLSGVRARVAAVVLMPAAAAAVLIHLLSVEARQALLAQRSGSQPGPENALLGQELLSLAAIATVSLVAIWFGSNLLVARGSRKLLSAAERIAARDRRSRSAPDRDRRGELGEVFESVTHDLRSALTSIKAAATLMLDHERALRENDRRELLETIRDGSDGLDRLITNTVQLSRTRTGQLQPRKISCAVDEVVSRSLERMRHRLRAHQVVFAIPHDLPEIPVDVVQLDQAVTNILENAARFSPPGSEITLSLARRNGSLLIRIEDRGPGIPPEKRDEVFEPFIKLASGGGAGLGLSISRAIVEAHGGRMVIEDPPGGGTAIVLELPVETPTVVLPDLSGKGDGR